MTRESQQLDDELTATLSIEDERLRVEKLIELAPDLPPELLNVALQNIDQIQDPHLRGYAIADLAPFLKDNQLRAALSIANNIYNLSARNTALGVIGQFLSEEARAELIENIKTTSVSADDRLKAWIGLADFLSADLKKEAISTALALPVEYDRSQALVALTPHLPDVWRVKALESARTISDQRLKVETLAGIIPFLQKREQANTLDEALTMTRSMSVVLDKADALLTLLPLIPNDLKDDLIRETVKTISAIEDPILRVDAAVRLARTLPPKQALGYLTNIASKLREVSDEKLRGEALISLAIQGPAELHAEILDAARGIRDANVKSSVIIQLRSIIEQEPSAPTQTDPTIATQITPEGGQDLPTSTAGGTSVISPDEGVTGGGSGIRTESAPTAPETLVTPPAEDKPPKAKPPRRPRPKTETPAPPEIPKAHDPEESVGVKTYLHSDRWTLDDQLNYSLYADAIAEFILHGDTRPPLAIGILAPWGQGKTTLMRLIQNQLEAKTKPGDDPPAPPVAPLLKPQLTFAYLSSWLRNPTNYKLTLPKLSYPTVWFNAWKYQNTEQLWAGMAYTILSQLVEQLNDQAEREKFWLALQAERIDLNAIRRDIHRMVFERIAPLLLICLTASVIGLVLLIAGFVVGNNVLGGGGGALFLASVVFPAVKWMATRAKVNAKPLEGKFAQYVRQPTYEGKLGFFHEIETDMLKVFRLLIAEGKPVVVFIDDLDRCSPGTVAQVIEAMNLFLSADFPDCYFVVGMDAQVVAASMEVAYENLDKKMKSVTRSYGSLGWYFMDKFIQLQFSIPNLTPDQRGTYLTKLFGQTIVQKEVPKAAELDIVEKKLEQDLSSVALKPEQLPQHAAQLSKLRVHRPQVWQRLSHKLIQTSAQQLSDDSPALQKYLQRYEPFLGSSPRGIKRFANLYRFYSLSQLSRQSQGLPACSPGALARWLVIMLRWPQVVRWIQWEGEAKLSAGLNSFHRAKDLEEQLLKTKSHAAWLTYLDKLDPGHAEWMSDKQLYEFLKTAAGADEKLSFAVETGVW